MSDEPCFGFFDGTAICQGCIANKRCRAVLVTDGFDVLSSMINTMVADLPEKAIFYYSERPSELVEQLLNPPLTAQRKAKIDQEALRARQRELDMGDL